MTEDALRYGRHTVHRDQAVPVARLLEQALAEERPIRLCWPGQDAAALVPSEPDGPTALLPKISTTEVSPPSIDEPAEDDDTEPTTATRQARRLLNPNGLFWQPRALVG